MLSKHRRFSQFAGNIPPEPDLTLELQTMRCKAICLILSICFLATSTLAVAQEKKETKITYEDHIKPIFRQHCFSCHNQNKKEGDLDLTNYLNLMEGGGSGAVIEPGEVGDSYLYGLVNHDDSPEMPPEQPKIAAEKIALLAKWIELGALENNSSKAKLKKKKTFSFGLSDPAVGKPAVMPLPAKLDIEPVLHTKRQTGVTAMATSPWAPLTAIAGQKQVLLYDSKTRELKGIFAFPEGVISVLKFSRNGSLLLAGGGRGGASGKVVVWNIKNGERIIEVGDELDTVLAADISSDQKLVALGGPQRMIRVYSTADNSLVYEIKKHTDWVTSMEFSPDGVLLVTGDRNGGVHVWEAFSGREYLTLKGHTKAITGTSWRLDSNIIATTSEDATIRLWEMNNGSQVKNWGAHSGGSLQVEFTRDGRLISSGRDKYAKIWDQNGKQLFAFPPFADIVMQVTHCDESNLCVAGDWGGEVRQYNAADGKLVSQITSNPKPLELQFADATANLATVTSEANALNAATLADKAAVDKISKDIASTKKLIADLTVAVNTLTAKAKTDLVSMNSMTKQLNLVKARVNSLTGAIPEFKKASDNAAAASSKLPTDAELKKVSMEISKILAVREMELKGKSAEMTKLTQSVTALTAAMSTENAKLQKSKADLATAKTNLTKLEPMLKPAQVKYVKAKALSDGKNAALANATATVNRWKSAIAFSKAYRDLQAKIRSENEALASLELAQAEIDEQAENAKSMMVEMQNVFAATKKQADDLAKKVVAIQSKVAETEKSAAALLVETNSIKKMMSQTAASIPLLTEAKAKIEAANKSAPNDQDLVLSLKAINDLAAKQNQKVVDFQKLIKTKTAAHTSALAKMKTMQEEAVAAEKLAAEMKAKLLIDQKQMVAAQGTADAVAKQAADAKEKVNAKSSEIVSLKAQVSKLQGIES